MTAKTTTATLSDKKALTVKPAVEKALAEIDTWPGEFSTNDVIGLARGFMHVGDDKALKRMLTAGHRHDEHVAVFLHFPLREWVLMRLRKRRDQYGLRVYICYRIKGQKQRHWLRLDNLTIKTLDYLCDDRIVFMDQAGRLIDYLAAGRKRMEHLGPDATFGDVKPLVVDDLAS